MVDMIRLDLSKSPPRAPLGAAVRGCPVDRTLMAFDGDITGVGTQSGHRLVIGRWRASPFGAFARRDARGTGRPSPAARAAARPVADFVAATYRFDLIEVTPGGRRARRRAPAGRRCRPDHRDRRRHAHRPRTACFAWCPALWPDRAGGARRSTRLAVLVMHGVRTRGTAGGGRTEWYGATDQRRVGGAAWHARRPGSRSPRRRRPARCASASAPPRSTPSVVERPHHHRHPRDGQPTESGRPPADSALLLMGPAGRISRAGRRARGGCRPGRGS